MPSPIARRVLIGICETCSLRFSRIVSKTVVFDTRTSLEAAALASAVAEVARLNGTLQLALDIADPFADLPWETLWLPQTGALALHPCVELYRRIDTGGAAPAGSIPGSLRILVAIGNRPNPDKQTEPAILVRFGNGRSLPILPVQLLSAGEDSAR